MRNGDGILVRSRKAIRMRGFTLTELLVVLVIIGLLAALVGPTLYQRIQPARQTVARTQMENLGKALDGFMIDVGRYPTAQEGLAALQQKPAGLVRWKGPYLKKDLPPDPWGNPYVYRVPGPRGPYEIVSFGADGKAGGEGDHRDINNWSTD